MEPQFLFPNRSFYDLCCPSWAVMTISLLLLTGCGGEGMQQVKGKITLPNGSPAADTMIRFDSVEMHVSANGRTDANGEYQLSSEKPGDGVKPGLYTVSVHQAGPEDSSQSEPPRQFPVRYERGDTSELTYEVKAGQENRFDIKLEEK